MKPIFLFFFILMAASASIKAQEKMKTIYGAVTDDATHQPLAGVSIIDKYSKKATMSDANGNFKIKVPVANPNATLIFHYVGYFSKTVQTGVEDTIHVFLSENDATLSDVVTIGYTTVRKKDLTGAVSSISAKDLKDIPLNSAAEALTGKLAGVQVTTTEGAPGSDVLIKVRGNGSITQDASPLYIIDGVEVEDGLAGISPQDIESIDVLKDASSTSIYGARGANGVIIVTTKGGKAMKPRVTYNGLFGIKKLEKELKVMNPYDFVMRQYEKSRGSTQDEANFETRYGSFDSLDQYKNMPFVDWQHETFGRNAFMQSHNVSVSGGNSMTTYNLSVTDNDEDGIMITSGYTRKMVNFRMDTKVSNALKIGFNARYSNQVISGAGVSDTGTSSYNMLRNTIKYRPFLMGNSSIDDLDDAYYDETNTGNALGIINPVRLSNAQYSRKIYNITNLNGYFNYTFNRYFSFRSTLGVNFNNQTMNTFNDYLTSRARTLGGSLPMAGTATNKIFNLSNSNVLTYSNRNSSEHHISILLGNELYNLKANGNNLQMEYFPKGISAEKALEQLNIGTLIPTYPKVNDYESRIVSFFTRADYSYKDKYLATFNLRTDGSSKFASDNRWGIFPSGAIAWRLSDEPFIKKLSFISDLKLRAGFGAAGNNRIDDYLYMNIFSPSTQYALNEQTTPGYIANNLANKNLKWETTISRNIGLDISLFKNRIQLTADVYKNTVDNLLIDVPIPPTSGYSTQLQNVGKISNKGLEIQLAANIIEHKNFTWNTSFNISFNKNNIEHLANGEDHYFAYSGFGISGQPADYIVQVGHPLGTMYGYVSDGFYQTSDFNYDASSSIYTLKDGVTDVSNVIGTPQPGWMKLKDLNGDHIIDDKDRTIIGNANPKFTGGLNQQFRYKAFDLSIFLNFVYGNNIYNANKIEFTNGYGSNVNSLAIMNNRWKTIDAQGNLVQQVVTVAGKSVVEGAAPDVLNAINKNAKLWIPISGAGAWYPTSWAMENGSFLRINNVTIGYTFSQKILKKIQGARIYLTVNNLAVITGYSGYDPEVSTRRSTPVTPGVDYSAYPRSRYFIGGINITF